MQIFLHCFNYQRFIYPPLASSAEGKNGVSKDVRPLKHDVTYKVFIIRGMMFPLVEFLCLLFRDCCHWSILDFPSSGALGILLEE